MSQQRTMTAAANTDDGSCEFADDACPGDLDGDGLVATPDSAWPSCPHSERSGLQ